MDILQEAMSLIPPHRDSIILRDMNVSLLRDGKYMSLLNDNTLTKLKGKPTRITDQTSTILYYSIVSKETHITQSGSIPIAFSDTGMIFGVGKSIL